MRRIENQGPARPNRAARRIDKTAAALPEPPEQSAPASPEGLAAGLTAKDEERMGAAVDKAAALVAAIAEGRRIVLNC